MPLINALAGNVTTALQQFELCQNHTCAKATSRPSVMSVFCALALVKKSGRQT